MRQIGIALLGPFEVRVDGQLVTRFEYAKVRALLAYLVMESHRPLSRTTLAALLWPDQPDRAARGNLSQALTTLRNALGDRTSRQPVLLADAETVQLHPDSASSVDVKQFLALLRTSDAHPHHSWRTCSECAGRLWQAMTLYRGNFLADFFIADSAVFEEWALLQREYLLQRALSTLERLAEWTQRRGDYPAAIEYVRRQVALEPLLEINHRALMRLLALNGELSAALAHYQQLQQLLAKELALEPEAATTALFNQIRQGDTTGLPAPQAPLAAPIPPTALIGRARELDDLCTRLQDPQIRALTVTGTGGIGKTRLALEAAHTLRYDFEDGVYFVELAPLNDAALVVDAIAQTLEVKERPGQKIGQTLLAYLRSKHLLLVLDNFEHLLTAAPLLAELLAASPALKVLVTSRELLHIRAEWQYTLEPLAEAEALQLFVQRAQAAAAGDDTAIYADICRRLEGLPLAIELIAARARVLPPVELLRQLERPLLVLVDGPRDAPERHQTLQNAIRWSFDLLDPQEQQVFAHLGVFAGGCTVEAAQAVLSDSQAALPGLAALHQASLLRQRVVAAETRFMMLETLREFALEQLQALNQEAHQTRQRHAEYFARLSMTAYTELLGPEGTRWLTHLTAEQDNIRAAFQWAMAQSCYEIALQLATGVWRFHWMRGYLREGLDHLEAALAHSASAPLELQSQAMRAAGTLAVGLSDYERARRWLEQAIETGRRLPDLRLVQAALTNLGFALLEQGEVENAGPYLEESLSLAHRDENPYTVKFPLSMLGTLYHRQGNLAQAVACFEESVRLNRACQDTEGTANSLRALAKVISLQGDQTTARQLGEEAMTLHQSLNHQLGLGQDHALFADIARDQGDYAGALQGYKRCLTLWTDRGNIVNSTFVFDDIAQTLSLAGRPAQAVKLMAAATAIRDQAKVKLTTYERDKWEDSLTACRTALGEDQFTPAWAEGQGLTPEQVVSLVLAQVI